MNVDMTRYVYGLWMCNGHGSAVLRPCMGEEEVVGRLKFQWRATNECRQCHGDSLHPHTAAMHAGGVAESSGPWNDDKDPFEVTSQH